MYSLAWGLALREFVLDREGSRLGIRVSDEHVALCGELISQRLEILDDAIVDDSEPARGVGMGVVLARPAMCRPAGMPDADRALQWLGGEPSLKILELALSAPPRELAVFESCDASRIVPAVFEALECADDRTHNRPCPQDPHYAAHRS